MSPPRRQCPVCDEVSNEKVCSKDRTATLLVDAPPSEAAPPKIGDVLSGRYELVSQIGRGGNGTVFRARHLSTGQDLAVKVLRLPPGADEPFAAKRFFLEAQVTSSLKHPNTVRVFDFGQEDSGLLFIAMELLVGRSLRQELRSRRKKEITFSEAEALEVAMAVTRSLAEAHEAGLVHRDLKPDNIFLHQVSADETAVKVLDFGIVKLQSGHHTLSSDTSSPGTPAYMSPEQALSNAIDPRTDFYALGVVLHEMVTGSVPFQGASDAQTLYMHAYESPPELRDSAANLTDGFIGLVRKMLEKDPARRPQNAREMRAALEACAEGRFVPTRRVEPLARASNLSLVWVALVAFLVGLVGVSVFLLRQRTVKETKAEVVAHPAESETEGQAILKTQPVASEAPEKLAPPTPVAEETTVREKPKTAPRVTRTRLKKRRKRKSKTSPAPRKDLLRVPLEDLVRDQK